MRAMMLLAILSLGSCDDDDDGPEGTGEICAVAADCYQGLEAEVSGDPNCFTNVEGGYCSHTCSTDADCCAVDGECAFEGRGELPESCAPFESFEGTFCFLSCEDDVLEQVAEDRRDTYCEDISPDLHCRATGGGDPRKVCLPEG